MDNTNSIDIKENAAELVIRQAKLYDVPAMARIERETFDDPWSADEITKDVTNSDGNVYVAVVMIGEERAGYADMRIVKGEAQIYNIAIDKEYRRQGIGEALLSHMIDKAEEAGCSLISLEVRDGNEAAIALYEKMGFQKVGKRPGYYSKGREDAILMDKYLGKIEIDITVD